MFRYMPRAGYRAGEKRVDVWLSGVQHGWLRALAAEWGCSLSDAVGVLVRREVERGGGVDCAGVGRDVVSGGGGFGVVEGGDGADHAGVGSADGGVAFVTPVRRLDALVSARLDHASHPDAVFTPTRDAVDTDPLHDIA